MNKKIALGVIATLALTMFSCGDAGQNGSEVETTVNEDGDTVEVVSDCALYEANGKVKKIKKTTYWDVDLVDGEYNIDSIGKNVFESTVNFDRDGKLKPRPDEVIKRDAKGRIVYWEDHRPNAESVSGGFLKDTIEYKYVNKNHMVAKGMHDYSIIVYDDDNKVVGEYSVPSFNYSHNSKFHVYKKFDKKGNWTERITIWSTQGKDAATPTVNYSIDRREISYY